MLMDSVRTQTGPTRPGGAAPTSQTRSVLGRGSTQAGKQSTRVQPSRPWSAVTPRTGGASAKSSEGAVAPQRPALPVPKALGMHWKPPPEESFEEIFADLKGRARIHKHQQQRNASPPSQPHSHSNKKIASGVVMSQIVTPAPQANTPSGAGGGSSRGRSPVNDFTSPNAVAEDSGVYLAATPQQSFPDLLASATPNATTPRSLLTPRVSTGAASRSLPQPPQQPGVFQVASARGRMQRLQRPTTAPSHRSAGPVELGIGSKLKREVHEVGHPPSMSPRTEEANSVVQHAFDLLHRRTAEGEARGPGSPRQTPQPAAVPGPGSHKPVHVDNADSDNGSTVSDIVRFYFSKIEATRKMQLPGGGEAPPPTGAVVPHVMPIARGKAPSHPVASQKLRSQNENRVRELVSERRTENEEHQALKARISRRPPKIQRVVVSDDEDDEDAAAARLRDQDDDELEQMEKERRRLQREAAKKLVSDKEQRAKWRNQLNMRDGVVKTARKVREDRRVKAMARKTQLDKEALEQTETSTARWEARVEAIKCYKTALCKR